MRDPAATGNAIARLARGAALCLCPALVLLLTTTQGLEAQNFDPARGSVYEDPVPQPPGAWSLWASAGLAAPWVSEGSGAEGLAHTYRVGIGRGSSALVIQYEFVDEAFGPGTPTLSDVGALWAKSWPLGPIRGTGAIGLSRASGFECVADGDDDPTTCDGTGTFAFPGYAQLDWQPIPFLGIGLYVSATVSPDGNWGSAGFIGRIGKLR